MNRFISKIKTVRGLVLPALLIAAVAWSLLSGPADIDLSTDTGHFILMQVRLPRTLLAIFVGMALSLAGAVFQALLRNPLADPHLLGVSAGGALGVIIGSGFLVTGGLHVALPLLSLLGSLGAVALVYLLSFRKGALSLYTLLLVGVMLNSVFVAVIVLLQSLVRSDELYAVLYWLLGNLSYVNYRDLAVIAVLLAAASVPILRQAKHLNVLSLGETTAHTLGLDVERTKRGTFFWAALLTGAAVSVSGMIGFVGLVVPNLVRLVFGSDYRRLLPLSAVLGGILLVFSDTIARTALRPQELPVGIVTALFGAPFFIFFLKRQERKRVV